MKGSGWSFGCDPPGARLIVVTVRFKKIPRLREHGVSAWIGHWEKWATQSNIHSSRFSDTGASCTRLCMRLDGAGEVSGGPGSRRRGERRGRSPRQAERAAGGEGGGRKGRRAERAATRAAPTGGIRAMRPCTRCRVVGRYDDVGRLSGSQAAHCEPHTPMTTGKRRSTDQQMRGSCSPI